MLFQFLFYLMTKNIIKIYLVQRFLWHFLKVFLAFAILFFLINLLENINKNDNKNLTTSLVLLFSLLPILEQISTLISSLVLIACITTFYTLAKNSEITIMSNSGYSLWQICQPVMVAAFLLGVFWITIGQYTIEKANNFTLILEKKYQQTLQKNFISGSNILWLTQNYLEMPNHSIIIGLKKYNVANNIFSDIGLWFFDEQQNFYQKINCQYTNIEEKWLYLNKCIINNSQQFNQKIEQLKIVTNLNNNLLQQQIVSHFTEVQYFSLFTLPKTIKNLQIVGLDAKKFIVHLYGILALPFNFLAMVLIAAYFGINNIRNRKVILKIFIGILYGLLIYIVDNIARSLGSANLISVFSSTWLINLIFIAIGILLIYRKERLFSS